MITAVVMQTEMGNSHMVLSLDEQISANNDFREMGNHSLLRMSPLIIYPIPPCQKNIHIQAVLNVCFINSSIPVCVTLGYVNIFSYVFKESNEEFSFLNISGAPSHAK